MDGRLFGEGSPSQLYRSYICQLLWYQLTGVDAGFMNDAAYNVE